MSPASIAAESREQTAGPLRIEKSDTGWTFILNRPEKRNALSAELVESLIEGVHVAHQQDVPLLVFRGEGKNFSAGFDFTGYEDQSEGDLLLRMVRLETLLQEVAGSPAVTAAFAHGRNFGAGVDLFAACKLRYSTPDATFRMPGLKFGLVLGSRRFRDLVGPNQALSILGAARSFDAAEALRIGFVQATAPTEDWPALLADAHAYAAALDSDARAALYQALDMRGANDDMAALVRSASRPGFKHRIEKYLAG